MGKDEGVQKVGQLALVVSRLELERRQLAEQYSGLEVKNGQLKGQLDATTEKLSHMTHAYKVTNMVYGIVRT